MNHLPRVFENEADSVAFAHTPFRDPSPDREQLSANQMRCAFKGKGYVVSYVQPPNT